VILVSWGPLCAEAEHSRAGANQRNPSVGRVGADVFHFLPESRHYAKQSCGARRQGVTVDARGENLEGRIVGLEGCASVFLSRAAPTLPLPSVCARGFP
jgi:hypothetical protein